MEAVAETPVAKNIVNLAIKTPEVEDTSGIVKYAREFEIVTQEDSLKAQEARNRINAKITTLNEARMALTRPIDAAKKAIMDFFRSPVEALESAKVQLDSKVIAFDDQQRQIAREAQRKANEKAEAERRKLEAEAREKQRKADEEAAAKRKAADEAATAGRAAEAEKLRAQAERVEEKAAERVEVLQERAAATVAPVIASTSIKATGTQFRDNWQWEVLDVTQISPAFTKVVPNDRVIDAMVKSLKLDAGAVIGQGIRIWNERGVAGARR